MKLICQNKKASYDYFILDRLEAGIKLTGTEIKAIRAGKININDAYVITKTNKVYILNMYIGKYDLGNIFNHDERRSRELLLNKKEIRKWDQKVNTDGVTIIPLKAYFVDALVKIEIALAKGKNKGDKRESLKEKESQMQIKKAMKNRF